jgi:hypothetical protein
MAVPDRMVDVRSGLCLCALAGGAEHDSQYEGEQRTCQGHQPDCPATPPDEGDVHRSSWLGFEVGPTVRRSGEIAMTGGCRFDESPSAAAEPLRRNGNLAVCRSVLLAETACWLSKMS